MIEGARTAEGSPWADYVEFRAAGEQATGEFRCSGCGYGVTVPRVLPTCPMCGGSTWEESARRPAQRVGDLWP